MWKDKLDLKEGSKKKWLVTGCAGFIGSHITETLVGLNQEIVGLDNFSTGKKENIDFLNGLGGDFSFHEGDVQDKDLCQSLTRNIDYVIHQAALGSVPRSLDDPINSHNSNVNGFLTLLHCAKENGVKSFVYASSSSVYGDHPDLPKVEDKVGTPLSPYAATKKIDEIYASVYNHSYGMNTVGLRYFNVFGERQDPEGPYAAVIPKWMMALTKGDTIKIFGDGETSRDFCYVDNAVQANILAALAQPKSVAGKVYNIAFGEQTTLLELVDHLKKNYESIYGGPAKSDVIHEDFRKGDVRHSLADISKARNDFGYSPDFDIEKGLARACKWYIESLG